MKAETRNGIGAKTSMIMKFENRCGCIDIGHDGGCIDIFIPDADEKHSCREKDHCFSKFFIEAPRACIKVAVIGGKPEGEVIFKV